MFTTVSHPSPAASGPESKGLPTPLGDKVAPCSFGSVTTTSPCGRFKDSLGLLAATGSCYRSVVNRAELLAFLRRHRLCVQASVSEAGAPQAAVIGFGVSDDLEIVFDTLGTTRKMANLRRDPRIALVVGWDEEQTVQIDGVVDEPTGVELDRLKLVYFEAYPDGQEREAWKDITYVRVRPTWARYSDFRPRGGIVELSETELRGQLPSG